MVLAVVTSQLGQVRVYDSLPTTIVDDFEPIEDLGDPVTTNFNNWALAGRSPLPEGWATGSSATLNIDKSVTDVSCAGTFYVAIALEDADHAGIGYSLHQMSTALAADEHVALNYPLTPIFSAEERAAMRYISVWGRPTGLDPQTAGMVCTLTPKLSATFTTSTTSTPAPPGDWTAIEYDDSSWQFPASGGAGADHKPPDSVTVTHALAVFPSASVGERVFYRQPFTLPAGDVISATFLAYVEDSTPLGVYINGHQLAGSTITNPSEGDVYNIVNVAIPGEFLNTPVGTVRYPIDFTCALSSGCAQLVEFPIAGRVPTSMHTHLDAPAMEAIGGGSDALLCSLRTVDGDTPGSVFIQANVLAGETDGTGASSMIIDDAATTVSLNLFVVGDETTPVHVTGYTDVTYSDGGDNMLALCVENTSGSALHVAYRLEINQGDVAPPIIGGCVPVNEFGGDTLGSFSDSWQLAGRQLCTSGWTQFTSTFERATDGTAGEAYLTLVFEDADQAPVNPAFDKGVFVAVLDAGETVVGYTNFEFGTPEQRDAIRYVSLWNRPRGTAPQTPDADYPIESSLSLTFTGCGPAMAMARPQVTWVM